MRHHASMRELENDHADLGYHASQRGGGGEIVRSAVDAIEYPEPMTTLTYVLRWSLAAQEWQQLGCFTLGELHRVDVAGVSE